MKDFINGSVLDFDDEYVKCELYVDNNDNIINILPRNIFPLIFVGFPFTLKLDENNNPCISYRIINHKQVNLNLLEDIAELIKQL